VAGAFGVLHLNQDHRTASANARRWLAEQGALDVLDLRPEARPVVVPVTFDRTAMVDAVTDAGLTALSLPTSYPHRVRHARCQPIGAAVHAAGERGIACRSAAECPGPSQYVGEEAALFEGQVTVTRGDPLPFSAWYIP
jgi:hypothetical protein